MTDVAPGPVWRGKVTPLRRSFSVPVIVAGGGGGVDGASAVNREGGTAQTIGFAALRILPTAQLRIGTSLYRRLGR